MSTGELLLLLDRVVRDLDSQPLRVQSMLAESAHSFGQHGEQGASAVLLLLSHCVVEEAVLEVAVERVEFEFVGLSLTD